MADGAPARSPLSHRAIRLYASPPTIATCSPIRQSMPSPSLPGEHPFRIGWLRSRRGSICCSKNRWRPAARRRCAGRRSRLARADAVVDHTFVVTPAVQKIRELTAGGELGDIYYYDSVASTSGCSSTTSRSCGISPCTTVDHGLRTRLPAVSVSATGLATYPVSLRTSPT